MTFSYCACSVLCSIKASASARTGISSREKTGRESKSEGRRICKSLQPFCGLSVSLATRLPCAASVCTASATRSLPSLVLPAALLYGSSSLHVLTLCVCLAACVLPTLYLIFLRFCLLRACMLHLCAVFAVHSACYFFAACMSRVMSISIIARWSCMFTAVRALSCLLPSAACRVDVCAALVVWCIL